MEESSSYRAGLGLVNARLHSYAWIVLLPAAAECTRLSFVGRASLAERAPSLSPKPLSPLGAALRSGRS